MPDYKLCDTVPKLNVGVAAVQCAGVELIVDMSILRKSDRFNV